jgi:hypothetical protein
MRTLLALGACAVALASAQPAAAQGRFHGENARGQVVELFSDDEGQVVRATVRWRLRCGPIATPVEVTSTMTPESATTSRREFAAVADDYDVEDAEIEGGVRIETAVTGLRHVVRGRPGAESWSGTFEGTVEIRAGSPQRLVKRCELRRTRWRAWREGYGTGTWRQVSEPGDYIGGGLTQAWDSRSAEIAAYGDPREIHVVMATGPNLWSAEFYAPAAGRLVRGARFVVPGDDDEDSARMEVDGAGRGCSDTRGEYTVRAARYRRGRLRDITIDFVQYCDGATAALRGTIDWRSSP